MDVAQTAHPTGDHGAGEHGHPGNREYVGRAAILAAITAIEVGLFYIDLAKGLVITLLLVLSIVKFTLVVLFFMHLKFDSKLFSWFFAGGLTVAMLAFFVMLAASRFFAA